jgi:eukaryotic-like serine/threonine-protein kinase
MTFGSEAGVLVGTPAYMSPEQLLADNPSISWDLWALAVVAFECLSGSSHFPLQAHPIGG